MECQERRTHLNLAGGGSLTPPEARRTPLTGEVETEKNGPSD